MPAASSCDWLNSDRKLAPRINVTAANWNRAPTNEMGMDTSANVTIDQAWLLLTPLRRL